MPDETSRVFDAPQPNSAIDRGQGRRPNAERGSATPRPISPTNKTRQGRAGWRVLMVLVVALLLAAIAWWGAEIYGEAIAPENPAGKLARPSSEPPVQ